MNKKKYVDLDSAGIYNTIESVEHKKKLTDILLFLNELLPEITNKSFSGFIMYIVTKIVAEKEINLFESANIVFDVIQKYYKYQKLLEKRTIKIDLEQKKIFAHNYIESYFGRLKK